MIFGHGVLQNTNARRAYTCLLIVMNPKFDFYKSLLRFIKERGDKHDLTSRRREHANELLKTYEEYKSTLVLEGLTFVQLQNLRLDRGFDSQEALVLRIMTICAFEALSSQMKNEKVQCLFNEWKEITRMTDHLFIHLRKKTSLGENVTVTTIVTSDAKLFDSFCSCPSAFAKEKVHYTKAP